MKMELELFLGLNIISTETENKYNEAERLASIIDPETEPYKSKYEARKILSEIHLDISNKLKENTTCPYVNIVLAAVHFKIGVNYSETDETESGCSSLNKSVEILKGISKDSKTYCINVLQCALNQLGIIWAGRSNYDEAITHLEEAENIYLEYVQENKRSPICIEDLFRSKAPDDIDGMFESRCQQRFELTFTETLFLLAQIYGKMEQNEKSAKYCHQTLSRQLNSGVYDPLEWSLNAATLSQYYVTHSDFATARHCLTSASFIVREVESPNDPEVLDSDSQADVNRKEKVPRGVADINRCWIKYGIALLEFSQEKMMSEINETDPPESCGGPMYPSVLPFNLELSFFEKLVTDKVLTNYSEAREVFLFLLKCIEIAKSFYIIDNFCSDYIEIIKDHSKCFKLLAFFEPDMERQCKMHKRRIDMMLDVVNLISVNHYLLVWRQLMYEVAETFSAILDLKLAIIEISGKTPTHHSVKKINSLANDSIESFQKYLDTLKTPEKNKIDTLGENDLRPALVAMFCMGRLHSKIIEVETDKRLQNIQKSLSNYKYIVDYCTSNPDATDKVKAELDICLEMVQLLPAKMDKIRSGTY